jgi:AcrR family transcriptional regulator
MAPQLTRRPGRPRSLTRDEVARAALAEGLGDLSMPIVARRLGVSHSTLYRYVHDRSDLLLAAVEIAVGEFDWPDAGPDWRSSMESFADAIWRFFQLHRGLAESTFVLPGSPHAVVEQIKRWTEALVGFGFPAADAMIALDFLVDLVMSSAVKVADLNRVHETAEGPRTVRQLYQARWSTLTETAPGIAEHESWVGRGWFDVKLAMFLDGLAQRLPG